jgi:uncharacterized linocin/CFP29 family protein
MDASMAHNDPQVLPWTDEQWARVQQVVQEEASRARLAATFLPLVGPLAGNTDFVRKELIGYAAPGNRLRDALVSIQQATIAFNNAMAAAPPDIEGALAAQQRIINARAIVGSDHLRIDDRDIIQLATLQIRVPVRGAQMADPDMTSVLALFRRAANVLARLEDAIVFRGLIADPANPGHFEPPTGIADANRIWEIRGGQEATGLWTDTAPLLQWVRMPTLPRRRRGEWLVHGVSEAIGRLESWGHYGPFAAVFDQQLFLVATTPERKAMVLPRDRIIPFLDGGPLLRSSTLDQDSPFPGVLLPPFTGLVMALGGAPVELVVARDVSCQFLQLTTEPVFEFRVYERMALRIKEPRAIVQLVMWYY